MKYPESASFSRRDWLKSLVTLGASTAVAGCSNTKVRPRNRVAYEGSPGKHNERVWSENQKEGTTDWLLKKPAIEAKSKYRCPWIEGYCSRTSVQAGDRLSFFVSTNPHSDFIVEIYRLGFYNGAGGRFQTRLGPFRGRVQPEPSVGPKRLRECTWSASGHFTI